MELGPKQEAWMQALESGEWTQCRNELHGVANSHCCLGVYDMLTEGKYKRTFDFIESTKWQELAPKSADIAWEFAGMNDKQCLSFLEIAAAVRANPTAFFKEPR